MAIVGREPDTVEGDELWDEEIAWFGSALSKEGVPRVGILTTNCILRDRALRDLEESSEPHYLVLEAATVASLRDAVEAGFCQAFLPVSMADGLQRSPLNTKKIVFKLTFCLIASPRLDEDTVGQVARKFRKAL